jgi:hypothetical protein
MKYTMLVVALIFSAGLRACDVCGGVGSNASIGLFASTRFHLVGFQSSYKSYNSYLYNIQHSSEKLLVADFNFRVQLHKRVQLIGSMPYQLSFQKTDFGSKMVYGFGDLNLISNFIVLNKRDSSGLSRNFLSIGAGLKSPTGKNSPASDPLKNLYPGTGSWDWTLIGNYIHQFTSLWGWQSELSYSFRGKDVNNFKYGNVLTLNSQAVLNSKFKAYRLISSFGLNGEIHDAASFDSNSLELSKRNGGYILSARSSVNLMTFRWLFSMYVQQPFLQNYNDRQTKQQLSCGFSINYLIIN